MTSKSRDSCLLRTGKYVSLVTSSCVVSSIPRGVNVEMSCTVDDPCPDTIGSKWKASRVPAPIQLRRPLITRRRLKTGRSRDNYFSWNCNFLHFLKVAQSSVLQLPTLKFDWNVIDGCPIRHVTSGSISWLGKCVKLYQIDIEGTASSCGLKFAEYLIKWRVDWAVRGSEKIRSVQKERHKSRPRTPAETLRQPTQYRRRLLFPDAGLLSDNKLAQQISLPF